MKNQYKETEVTAILTGINIGLTAFNAVGIVINLILYLLR